MLRTRSSSSSKRCDEFVVVNRSRKVAREVGVPEQSIRNWVKAQAAGKLGVVTGGKPITPEQMEISRLRSENARLKMEAEILKKAAAYFARESL